MLDGLHCLVYNDNSFFSLSAPMVRLFSLFFLHSFLTFVIANYTPFLQICKRFFVFFASFYCALRQCVLFLFCFQCFAVWLKMDFAKNKKNADLNTSAGKLKQSLTESKKLCQKRIIKRFFGFFNRIFRQHKKHWRCCFFVVLSN